MASEQSFKETWNTYASSWGATSDKERRERYQAALDPECVYTDPQMQARGFDELLAYMKQFHEQVPGGYFVTREFTAHHDRSLAKWNMCGADGTVLGDGISYGEYNQNGKLVAMTGFFKAEDG
ncbi:MAG: nuclear transport factor 2 family protein [Myxococcota bacterium]